MPAVRVGRVTVGDRLRAVPRPWWVIGICGLAVVLAFALVSWTGSSGSVASNDAPEPTAADDVDRRTHNRHLAGADAGLHHDRVPRPRTAVTTSTVAVSSTIDLSEEYGLDVEADDPAVVARPIPEEPTDSTPPSTIAPPPWAASTRTTAGRLPRRRRRLRQRAHGAGARQVLRRPARPGARLGLPARLPDG